jgi:multisubunit Na+/H+ antiporter MnhE subunit
MLLIQKQVGHNRLSRHIVVAGKLYISAIVYTLVDKSLNTNCGCDIIKTIMFFLIFLIGLASAYTSEQQTALNETTPKELMIIPVSTKLKNPFKAGSDLSKFGKQQVYDL